MKPALAVLLLAAAPALGGDLAVVKARGTLRVLAVVLNQEDVFMSGKPGVGFDRELLGGFCALHRIRLELVPQTSWGALVPALQNDQGDVIAGRFNVTPARRELIEFTAEVFPSRHVVLTRKPHRLVRTVAELRTEKVGTVKGTSMAEAVAAAGAPASQARRQQPARSAARSTRVGPSRDS
jgi:ABC-type amino acid transport substrate-binding protein